MKMIKREEIIKRWAEFIIPSVFIGENRLGELEPGLLESMRDLKGKKLEKAYKDYCRKIAEIIVDRTYKKH